MGHEANVDLIRALEKQIEEGKGDLIKLKRDRNSLLNISTRVPPEILGHIFAWCLVAGVQKAEPLYQPRFNGLRKGSYNFLPVCHHWFEVASRTPELWSSWGNNLQDWGKRHHRPGTGPLDLVLIESKRDPDVHFDESLRDAVKSRVMQDAIRQAHLVSYGDDGDTLISIISALTPDDEGGQNENIESISWRHHGYRYYPIDVSDFFARSRLSKLRLLEITGNFRISSWDGLASRTTSLISLSLEMGGHSDPPSPILPASRLLSILTSNPNLQELSLHNIALPDDTDTSTLKVPLRNLKSLVLTGDFRRLLGLLRQLILPGTLDTVYLVGSDPTVEEVSQILGPYMRDYFRRNTRFQDELIVSSGFYEDSVSISVQVLCTQTTTPTPRVSLMAELTDPPRSIVEQLFVNLVEPIPREHIVSFYYDLEAELPDEFFLMMPNIEALRLCGGELSEGFLQPNPDGPHANTKLLPSLRSLCLENVSFLDEDWDYLVVYLAHQTSDGQAISLEVVGEFRPTRPGLMDEIKGLVEEFIHHNGTGSEDAEE